MINEFMNECAVCRIAPATPGLSFSLQMVLMPLVILLSRGFVDLTTEYWHAWLHGALPVFFIIFFPIYSHRVNF